MLKSHQPWMRALGLGVAFSLVSPPLSDGLGAPFAVAETPPPETTNKYIHPDLATGSTEPVGITFFFAIDSSGSIQNAKNEYQAQLDVIADAISRHEFWEAIFYPGAPGSAAIVVADYSSYAKLRVAGVDFRELDMDKAYALAETIRALPRVHSSSTSHYTALKEAGKYFENSWDSQRNNVIVFTDGTGRSDLNFKAMSALASDYGATVSSFTTRVAKSDIFTWCQSNLTTPHGLSRADGTDVPAGITVEVATELQTQGNNVAPIADRAFGALLKMIVHQSASLESSNKNDVAHYLTAPKVTLDHAG